MKLVWQHTREAGPEAWALHAGHGGGELVGLMRELGEPLPQDGVRHVVVSTFTGDEDGTVCSQTYMPVGEFEQIEATLDRAREVVRKALEALEAAVQENRELTAEAQAEAEHLRRNGH